jgi:hypothetical protein
MYTFIRIFTHTYIRLYIYKNKYVYTLSPIKGKLLRSVDYHKNLTAIKGSEELIRKLKDLFTDFEEHELKIRYLI